MIINPFQPMIVATPLAVTASAQQVTIAYDTKVLTNYRFVVVGTVPVFFLWTATVNTVTVTNGIIVIPGEDVIFTGPPNAQIQAIASGTGSTFYAYVGEGA